MSAIHILSTTAKQLAKEKKRPHVVVNDNWRYPKREPKLRVKPFRFGECGIGDKNSRFVQAYFEAK